LNTADLVGCETVIDLGGAYFAPGLIDIHTHGRVGGNFISAYMGLLQKMLGSYLPSGVTSLMPTLASATPDELAAATDRVISLAGEDSIIEGIHLKGRYLNSKKRGAHAPERLIGIYDKVGWIEVGKRANMLVLDDEYKIETVIFGGKAVK
jgi:N-acetylglucosamine-6-phosphate deacetylase